MQPSKTLRAPLSRLRTAVSGRRLLAFFERYALNELLALRRGSKPCRHCAAPTPDGALSLILDLRQGPRVCPSCKRALDEQGGAAGRLLASGKVVLQELVFIERG